MASTETEPSLADVIARLDKLERAVTALTEALAVGRPKAKAAATPTVPVMPVAQPEASAEPAPAEEVPAARPPLEELPEPEGAADVDPVLRDIAQAITRLFQCAMIEDKEECFERLEALWHVDAISSPRSLDYLRAFNWPKLRRSLGRYLEDVADPRSYGIARTQPADLAGATSVKVFLDQKGAMPAPVHMVRDDADSHEWQFEQVSL